MAKSKTIIKNCSTCQWSERNVENLKLYCIILPHHTWEIKNTWTQAEECGCYTSAAEMGKSEHTVKHSNNQLKLF